MVAGLGSSAYDVAAAGGHPLDFCLWGAMGGAAMIGFGLAVARPGLHVAVITGDGEALMGMGALATIGARKPANLSIVVLDNALYGETGGQASHTGLGTDLVAVAAACGFAWSQRVTDAAGVAALAGQLRAGGGPRFASVSVSAEEVQRVLPGRDGVEMKNRFRAALGLPGF